MLDHHNNLWWTEEAIRARVRERHAGAGLSLPWEYRSREELAGALRSALAADAARRRRRLARRIYRGVVRILSLLGQ
ncbi:MAG TPA: hypothetical protein VIK73_07020 [Limnochordales bacterium]